MKITEKKDHVEIDGVILTTEIISKLSEMQNFGDNNPAFYGPAGGLADVILFIAEILSDIDEKQKEQAIIMLDILSYARSKLLILAVPMHE